MVPNRNDSGHAFYGVALVGLGVLVHYGWAWFPAEHQAQAWNALGAFARLLAISALGFVLRSSVARFACFWWACEELLVIGCSTAFMVSPWQVPPGQAQCSALMQFDLGRIGMAAAVLALLLSVRSYTLRRSKTGE